MPDVQDKDELLREARRLLARAHDRIHILPRSSDTELAAAIGRLLARLQRID